MARPREFDEEAALTAAIGCFWARGYEATSTRDLADAMGIAGKSLYNTFGDKHELFRQALERYLQGFDVRISRFEGRMPPQQAIRAFFDEVVEQTLSDPGCKGCMLVNSAIEVAPHDPDLRQVVAKSLAKVEAFFRRCVAAGQQSGTIPTVQTADDLARHLLAVLLGLRVLARSGPERALLESILRPTFSLLGEAPSGRRRQHRRTLKHGQAAAARDV
jgi:TetR/AcrR family transcriptional regulator, transcriptional repressor for nem operon